jgi:polysaccharide biosynthesis transport protein
MPRGDTHDPRQTNGKSPHEPASLILQVPEESEEEGVIDLGRVGQTLQRNWRWVAGITGGVTALATAWAFLGLRPMYTGEFQIVLDQKQGSASGNVGAIADPRLLSMLGVNTGSSNLDTEVEILRSPAVLLPAYEMVRSVQPAPEDYDYDEDFLGKQLKVELTKGTAVAKVQFEADDQQLVQKVLERISADYQKYSNKDRKTGIQDQLAYLEQAIPKQRLELRQLENELESFRRQYQFVDPDQKGSAIAEGMKEIDQELIKTRVSLQNAQAAYQSAVRQLGLDPQTAIAAATLSSSAAYQDLLKDFQDVQAKLAIDSARLTDTNPVVQGLKEKQRNLLVLLNQEAARILGSHLKTAVGASAPQVPLELSKTLIDSTNQVAIYQAQLQVLEQARRNFSQQLQQMPALITRYSELVRDTKIKSESLSALIAQQVTLKLEAAKNPRPWELISQPTVPDRPKTGRLRTIALGGLGGLVLGAIAALVVDRRQSLFFDPNELKNALGLPEVGRIPYHPRLGVQSAQTAQSMAADEQALRQEHQFREALRLALVNLDRQQQGLPNVVLVSSAQVGEGKSTLSEGLAQAAASLGRRTLLIDGDLRRSQLSRRLQAGDQVGLAQLLADPTLTTASHVQNLDSGLDLLPAGRSATDPARLLDGSTLAARLQGLRAQYDLILIDAPPLLGLSDTLLLQRVCDVLLVIAALGVTSRGAIAPLKQALEQAPQAVLLLNTLYPRKEELQSLPLDYYTPVNPIPSS